MKRARGIAVAGTIIVDFVKTVDVYPQPTMLANICAVSQNLGGCVCNTAADLKSIDSELRISAIGLVGEDESGAFVLREMTARGIDCSGVRPVAGGKTSFGDVLSVKETGERTFFHFMGANVGLNADDILGHLDCEHLHFGYLSLLRELDSPDPAYGIRAARMLAEVVRRGIRTSVDLVSGDDRRVRELALAVLPFTDDLIVNETEAGMVAGLTPRRDGLLDEAAVRTICERLKSAGVRRTVVVHAPERAFYWDGRSG